MTYAAHQEAVSRALHDLIRHREPLSGGEEETALQCRHLAVASLRERLAHLGDGYAHDTAPRRFRVEAASRQPLVHLSHLIDTLPQTGPNPGAPSDLLPGPPAQSARSVVDRWRSVARGLMLGNVELTGAEAQPWTLHKEAAWYLVADIATTLEAVVVLDHQLSADGALPTTPSHLRVAQRLAAADVARVARWYGTDNTADLAAASALTEVGLHDGPRIRMLRRVEDYAPAQRTLAGFLRAERTTSEHGLPQERPGLLAARAVAMGQLRLAGAFAGWCAREAGGSLVAEQILRRVPAFQALHRSTTRLTEVEPRRSPLALTQQSEMVIQLRAIKDPRLSRASMIDLNEATHALTVTLGKALRREGMQRKNIVVLEPNGLGLPQARAITSTRNPFHAACKQLAEDPPPMPHERWAAPVEREKLRMTLDQLTVGNPTPVRRMSARVAQAPAPGRHPFRSTSRGSELQR